LSLSKHPEKIDFRALKVKKIMTLCTVLSPVITAGHFSAATAPELIPNGGFETGTFEGWTTVEVPPESAGLWLVNEGTKDATNEYNDTFC